MGAQEIQTLKLTYSRYSSKGKMTTHSVISRIDLSGYVQLKNSMLVIVTCKTEVVYVLIW